MATGVSGSYSTNASTYDVAKVTYSETYDVANKTSDVTATLYYRRTNTYQYPTYAPGTYYVKINGTNYAVYTGTFTIPANNNDWQYVGSKKVTGISHNADGSKTITIGGSFTSTVSGSYMDFSISRDTALTTIPRASTSSVSPNPLTLSAANNTLTVTTNRASSSFTHTVKVICGTWNSTQTGVGASTTFSIPQSVLSQMTSTQMSCSVETTTYNGSTQIGSKTTTTFKVAAPSSEYAALDSYTLSDTNQATAAVEASGTFIKNASNLSLAMNFQANGSYTTLASAKVTYDGVTQTFPLSGTTDTKTFTKNRTGSTTITVEVTDNRGSVTSYTILLTLINYEPVAFTTVLASRTNAQGEPSATGTYISFSVTVKCFEGSFGNQSNTLSLVYKYKLVSANSYTDGQGVYAHTASGTGQIAEYTFTGITPAADVFSSSSAYDLVFTVSDIFSSASTQDIVINEGLPVAGWGKDHFDVYGEFHVHDRNDPTKYRTINADGMHWTSFGTVSGSNTLQFTHSNYAELLIVVTYQENANYTWVATALLPSAVLTNTDQYVLCGARIAASTGNDKGANVKVSTAGASIYEFANNRSYVSSAQLTVYYR